MAAGLDGTPFFTLMFMATVGYDTAYPDVDLGKYLNGKGRELLKGRERLPAEPGRRLDADLDGVKKIVDYTTRAGPPSRPGPARRSRSSRASSPARE
ncbi:hypothetical protein [Actinomadura rubrisoli]|uniref:hypothetical protein n=1 Tax=Actinomadura rubrisoli TaxID=2530368 RepID=UPI00140482AA|nr:hypothetical protein [Actinomadura rubrisoli]